MSQPPRTIAVVGLGPRGLAVLERLSANHPAGCPLSVHVVDPYPPGPGRVWRTRQSPHLLMNTVTSQVSQFTDDSVACAGPVRTGPSLYEWLRRSAPGTGTAADSGAGPKAGLGAGTPLATGPEGDGGERLGPDDYPSRAQYGRYLEWVFGRLVAEAPAEFEVIAHRATAVALTEDTGGQTLALDDGTRITGLDAVVLTLGHGPAAPSAEERRLAAYAETHGLRYHPPANPADLEAGLAAVASGERVALRGLGLAFFDVMALLTEGRGGKYVPSPSLDGGLQYLPSGDEPVLYAGSRRGVPYHSRGENQKGASGRHEPLFLTLEAVARIRAAPGATFGRDIWPLLEAEVATVYHRALVAQWADEPTAARFLTEYLAAPAGGRTAVLRRFGVRAQDEWKWSRVERPWGRREFDDPARFARWLVEHLHEDVRHARGGNVGDPLKAALDVLRDLRNEVRLAVDHSGVTGSSYRDEIVRWFTPLNAFLSIGPPPSRVEEMAALVDCGLLTVVGPGARVREDPGGKGFLFGSDAVPGSEVRVDALIEARIPEPDLRRSTNPLIARLLADGQCRPYRIADPGPEGAYESGGMEVTPRPYRLVDAAGVPHPRRFAFGVPTENVHWATAAGIRPGVGSVILEDADAVARAVLGR